MERAYSSESTLACSTARCSPNLALGERKPDWSLLGDSRPCHRRRGNYLGPPNTPSRVSFLPAPGGGGERQPEQGTGRGVVANVGFGNESAEMSLALAVEACHWGTRPWERAAGAILLRYQNSMDALVRLQSRDMRAWDAEVSSSAWVLMIQNIAYPGPPVSERSP